MTEIELIRKLSAKQNNPIVRNNKSVFSWEADALEFRKDGYIVEYEIKTTRGDYTRDTQKTKHIYFSKYTQTNVLLPNYFVYLAPDGMIIPTTLPYYAGLITYNEQQDKFDVVKKPVLLNDKKLSMNPKILWKALVSVTTRLNNDI